MRPLPTLAPAGFGLLQPISSFSPFPADGCGVPGARTPNSKGEPSVAVNPRNPSNVIAVWQQDRFVVDGGALSNIVGVSKNGGRTWRRVEVPGLSRCTGGTDERTSDPWVSIGPDGTAYLATLTFTEHPDLVGLAGPTSMLLSRSTNGGITWSRPVTIVNDNVYDDRESVTADPRRPGHAYYVWVRRLGIVGAEETEFFSRTANGGRTWSAPRQITVLRAGTLPDPSFIEVLPNGTLVNLYLLANASPFASTKCAPDPMGRDGAALDEPGKHLVHTQEDRPNRSAVGADRPRYRGRRARLQRDLGRRRPARQHLRRLERDPVEEFLPDPLLQIAKRRPCVVCPSSGRDGPHAGLPALTRGGW